MSAMRERLPIWLQAMLLVAVFTVPPAVYWWLCKAKDAMEQQLRVRVRVSSYDEIRYMALPVVYLGFSFCYRVVRTKEGMFFLSLGLALTVVAFCMFLLGFPEVQRVSEAYGLWSSA